MININMVDVFSQMGGLFEAICTILYFAIGLLVFPHITCAVRCAITDAYRKRKGGING